MPADRLDAIVLGADIEGLFAAVAMASAGRHVCVFDSALPGVDRIGGEDCLVSLAAVSELDLVSHGLRLCAPPPIVGMSAEQTLVLWPDTAATQASLATISLRDADAWESFCARIMRGASANALNADASLANWHLAATATGDVASETAFLRATTLERVLDEEFASPLLKGMLAQGALLGTGASPRAPGSATLLMRHSLLSLFGETLQSRHVAGGIQSLRDALLASLKFCNTAEVRQAKEIRSLQFEKDALTGVVLQDGTAMRAAAVISTLRQERLSEWSAVPSPLPAAQFDFALPGQVRFHVRSVPAFKGTPAGLATSGAVLRLNPTLERLMKAHGAYRARQLEQDFCLDLRVVPSRSGSGPARWDVVADVAYVPTSTKEGPWNGNRRERLVAAVSKAIEAWAPGFEATVESSDLLEPIEARTIMEGGAPATLERQSMPDPSCVPALRPAAVGRVTKGLWSIEPSLVQGAGAAGLGLAKALGVNGRSKGAADA
jgi:phytoene dehydrogenase-like protein